MHAAINTVLWSRQSGVMLVSWSLCAATGSWTGSLTQLSTALAHLTEASFKQGMLTSPLWSGQARPPCVSASA